MGDFMKKIISLLLILMTLCGEMFASVNIIPKPNSVIETKNQFTITHETKIVTSGEKELEMVVDYLKEMILLPTGFLLEVNTSGEENAIILDLDESKEGNVGSYELTVTDKNIKITANSAIGCFYGVQSLRQLLPPEIESKQNLAYMEWKIPGVKIQDEPRFQYRGLMLDVGRNMFPVEFIKKYIDLLALHKMNKFHWHLTEDQGWRIEIKKYPKLMEIAAFRDETVIGHAGNSDVYDGKRYGGYYTQEEVKEIVAYAKSRFVTVIPEIELPGHSQAALAAYPDLGCTGGPYQVATTWGVHSEVYCAGKEKTFEFLKDVMDEVVDLFPSKYIHIGGDECPKTRWEECPDCQKRIKDEGLKNEHELQSYFIHRMEKYLLTKGRYIIGWDEILEGGLAPQATVMSWRGIAGGIEAAKQKHDVIMTPNSHCYLDYYQTDPSTQPLAIGGNLPLKRVYSYEPIPEELNKDEEQYILGVQGNVWTEYMNTPKYVEYMAYPRAIAIAEIGWSAKDDKDFNNFKKRLNNHYDRLDELFVNYFYEIPKPEAKSTYIPFTRKTKVTLHKAIKGAKIFYTTDGSNPDENSATYKKPISMNESTTIKAITYIPGSGEKSHPLTITAEKLDYKTGKKISSPENKLNITMKKGEFWSLATYKKAQEQKDFFIAGIQLPKDSPRENFGYTYNGWIKAEKKGIYHFYLTSDDGSELRINGTQIIDNDGAHGPEEVAGAVALKPGYHKIEVNYFQLGGGATLQLKWSPPGTKEKQPINQTYLFH